MYAYLKLRHKTDNSVKKYKKIPSNIERINTEGQLYFSKINYRFNKAKSAFNCASLKLEIGVKASISML
jgi:hypothetical protein